MEDSAPIETEWQKELDIASLLHFICHRIDRCTDRDKNGVSIGLKKKMGKYRSVLHINPHALEEAQKIDAELQLHRSTPRSIARHPLS